MKQWILLGLCIAYLMQANVGIAQAPKPAWDTYSDTWVAVDALGRPLPTSETVGPPRANKTVGIFYFLTFDHGSAIPYDNSVILKAHPEALQNVNNPAWGPLNTAHYWGEPLFGYYASDDEWVLRKHAQMLSNAGVDVVIFDNSNNVTYDHARDTLCRVWESIRRQGGATPQIAFHCPFGNPNGIGTATLNELYETLYAPDRYPDLWFRWNGKPLVIAVPSYADANALAAPPTRMPTQLSGGTLGQTFIATRPFTAVGGDFPTWSSTDSGMTLSLLAHGPDGRLLANGKFENVVDNSSQFLTLPHALPPGGYYLEMSNPVGTIGWWGYSEYTANGAYVDGDPVCGDRALQIRYDGDVNDTELVPDNRQLSPGQAAERARELREFFTFRAPIAPYNLKTPPRGAWSWLQIYPQSPLLSPSGKVEEVSVGVAQNYNAAVNRTAPMSFPGAFGRSYHDGKMETGPDSVRHGYNFAEQWNRALQIDPPFVFVTGWNEWTAGFYDEWAGFHAPPAIFVDEFDEEFSRDIEPMRGGHGDDYYYQLVANIRRYKGVRAIPPVVSQPITMQGRFSEWNAVEPEFRDSIGDVAHRNATGYGIAGPYVNTTGRNDIVAAKVSYDSRNIYFYVRSRNKLTPRTGDDWMLLYIDADADSRTGWLGYDYVVNRGVGENGISVEKNVGGQYRWKHVAYVPCVAKGNQIEIAIPRAVLGIAHLPATIDFKWADHCYRRGDWTDFTLYGDAAPNDRFNYRAIMNPLP